MILLMLVFLALFVDRTILFGRGIGQVFLNSANPLVMKRLTEKLLRNP